MIYDFCCMICESCTPNGNMKMCNPQRVVIVVIIVVAAKRIACTGLYNIVIGFTCTTFRVAKVANYFKTKHYNLKILKGILYFRSIAANSITISFKNIQKWITSLSGACSSLRI
jgi:hypothetical protein